MRYWLVTDTNQLPALLQIIKYEVPLIYAALLQKDCEAKVTMLGKRQHCFPRYFKARML